LGRASYPLFLSGLGTKPDCCLESCGKLGLDFWPGLARSNLSFILFLSRRFFARLFMKRLYRRRNRSLQRNCELPFSKRILAEQAYRLIVGNYSGVSSKIILNSSGKKGRNPRGIISIPNGHRYSVIFLEILSLVRPIIASLYNFPTARSLSGLLPSAPR